MMHSHKGFLVFHRQGHGRLTADAQTNFQSRSHRHTNGVHLGGRVESRFAQGLFNDNVNLLLMRLTGETGYDATPFFVNVRLMGQRLTQNTAVARYHRGTRIVATAFNAQHDKGTIRVGQSRLCSKGLTVQTPGLVRDLVGQAQVNRLGLAQCRPSFLFGQFSSFLGLFAAFENFVSCQVFVVVVVVTGIRYRCAVFHSFRRCCRWGRRAIQSTATPSLMMMMMMMS
mmetsp:Transcript_17465/g.40659  ORF Transcript_17465/g.40659 Transcript_17465/m.40659 type:complete len:227 (-) Transcript_17465:41-721(-)